MLAVPPPDELKQNVLSEQDQEQDNISLTKYDCRDYCIAAPD
jgi:hypothetical protein